MIAVLLVLLSPAIGSFLAVLADRLPRHEDVIRAPSACRACGTRLGWRDLVPVLSYLITRGRCRHCAAPIPPWLLYTELTALGLALCALSVAPTPAEAWAIAGALWLLLALGLSDLLWFRLPDPLTAALGALALGLAWGTGAGLPGHPDLIQALVGAALGAGSFAVLRWGYHRLRGREGLGLGDVKLMLGAGALLGAEALPVMVLMAATTALAVALVGGLRGGRLDPTRPLPFGAALAAASAVLLLVLRV